MDGRNQHLRFRNATTTNRNIKRIDARVDVEPVSLDDVESIVELERQTGNAFDRDSLGSLQSANIQVLDDSVCALLAALFFCDTTISYRNKHFQSGFCHVQGFTRQCWIHYRRPKQFRAFKKQWPNAKLVKNAETRSLDQFSETGELAIEIEDLDSEIEILLDLGRNFDGTIALGSAPISGFPTTLRKLAAASDYNSAGSLSSKSRTKRKYEFSTGDPRVTKAKRGNHERRYVMPVGVHHKGPETKVPKRIQSGKIRKSHR